MDRRTFLAATGALAAAPVAGCLDGGSGAAPDESVAGWAVATADAPETPYSYVLEERSPAQLLAVDDEVEADVAARLDVSLPEFWDHVAPADVQRHVDVAPGSGARLPPYEVFTGSFDTGPGREALGEAGQYVGTHAGFDVYADLPTDREPEYEPWTRAAAVSEDAFVRGGAVTAGRETAVEHVERIVDAAVGDADRVVDQDEPLRLVADRLEPGVIGLLARNDPDRERIVAPDAFPGQQAEGLVGTLDGTDVRLRRAFAFESADAATATPLEEAVARLEEEFAVDAAEHEVDGRVATVEAETGVEALLPE